MTDDTEDLSHLSAQAQCFVLAANNFGKPNGIKPTYAENVSPEECFCMALFMPPGCSESKPYWQALRVAGFELSAAEALGHRLAHAQADRYIALAEMSAIETETTIKLRVLVERLGSI